ALLDCEREARQRAKRVSPGPLLVDLCRFVKRAVEPGYGYGIELAVACFDRTNVRLDNLLSGDLPRREKAQQLGGTPAGQLHARAVGMEVSSNSLSVRESSSAVKPLMVRSTSDATASVMTGPARARNLAASCSSDIGRDGSPGQAASCRSR